MARGTHMLKKVSRKQISCTLVALMLAVFPSAAQTRNEPVQLSADQAVKMAMEKNRTIKALDHQLKGADYSVKSAATNLLPHIALNGSYTRLGMDDEMKLLSGGNDNSYSIGMQIQQPVFTGFATLNGLHSARVSRAVQESGNETVKQTIRYAVLQIYWGLVNLQKSQTVASEAVRQLEELTSNQEAMMEQGMATEHDYLLTKASLEQARMNELNVKKSISSMKREFAVLLGIPVSTEIALTDTSAALQARVVTNADSVVQAALHKRPDLQETASQVELTELGVKIAQSALYPTLSAGFSYSNARPDQLRRDQWSDNWAVSAQLNFTLWDWGNRNFQIRKAKEQQFSVMELLEDKKATVEKEVLDAYFDVEQSSKELEVAELLVGAREKAYEASLAKHSEGVIPMFELLDAHSSYISAKFQALQAATNLELAVINLDMGGLGSSSRTEQTR